MPDSGKRRGAHVTPRPTPSKLKALQSKTQPRVKSSSPITRYARFSEPQLRKLAAKMRKGKAPERDDVAGWLEALADTLAIPTGVVGRPRATYQITRPSAEPVTGDIDYVAALLGVTAGTAKVMMSRGGGEWRTLRPGPNGPETVTVSRQKPSEFRKAESADTVIVETKTDCSPD
jgi:hypothetical protein